MKKRRIIKSNGNIKPAQILKNNQKTVFLIFIFIIGVFFGATSIKNADAQLLIKIKELTESFLKIKSSQSILLNFTTTAVTDLLFISVATILGLCIIGAPFLWSIPAIRGMGIGLILGYIYSTYSVDGLLFSIIVICIPTSVSAYATIVSCKEGILTVKDLQTAFSSQKEFNKKQYFKMYFLRSIILYMVMLFASALGSILLLIPTLNLPY